MLTVQTAAEIAGVSTATLYNLSAQGCLSLRKLAGRTLVETGSLIAVIENADRWTPGKRGRKAVEVRIERARSGWAE